MTATRKKILVTLAGGGFLWETQSLIKGLGDSFEYHYATGTDLVWKAKEMGIPKNRIHPIESVTILSEKNLLRRVRNLLFSFRDSYKIMKQVNPVAVVCIGTSLSVPLCFWGKVFRKKTVFVESMTRVTKLSLTGKVIGTIGLCDRFYVQWPETARLQRGAIYRGSVL